MAVMAFMFHSHATERCFISSSILSGLSSNNTIINNHMKAIVILAHGWNAGWLGCYGNEWLTTPQLDRLAAESVVYDQHFAVNPSPDEWQRSLMTGRFELSLPPAQQDQPISLIHTLRQSAVRTVRIQDVRAPSTTNDWDVSIAVARQDDAPPGEALSQTLEKQLASLAASDQWLLWIETDRLVPPWPVSLDYFDPYAEDLAPGEDEEPIQPWDEPPLGRRVLPEPEFQRLHATFASVVSEWDADLGRCFDLFRQHGLAESALWMISSGHGLSLGEHDWIGPEAERLYEELVHLPLMVRMPKAEQAGRRISEQTGTLDLLPTLGDAFQVSFPVGIHGRSLLPLARGSRIGIRPYLVQALSTGQRALRTADWAFLQNDRATPLLFRKPEDRWEMNDSRKQHLEWADHLEQTLQEFIKAAAKEPFDPPLLIDYQDIIDEVTPETEKDDEHGSTGG